MTVSRLQQVLARGLDVDSCQPSGRPAWVGETTHGRWSCSVSLSGSTPGHRSPPQLLAFSSTPPQGWARTQASLLVYGNNKAPQGPPLWHKQPDHTPSVYLLCMERKAGLPLPFLALPPLALPLPHTCHPNADALSPLRKQATGLGDGWTTKPQGTESGKNLVWRALY